MSSLHKPNKKNLKGFFTFWLIITVAVFLVHYTLQVKYNSSFFHLLTPYKVYAQKNSVFNGIYLSEENHSSLNNDITTKPQDSRQIVKASGHFANNQIKNGIVTWIQGGFWNLDIKSKDNKNISDNTNMTADFKANFTMIKPDGSLSHNHIINNLTSNNIIFAGNDIIITGNSDILSDNGTKYTNVPITIHLMGKKVLGLMIDVNKTNGHFSSSNEMFGTLISGIGLDKSNLKKGNKIITKSNDMSLMHSMNDMMH